jgi:Glycosyltransferases, probably involved in cell wall biogenesis
MNLLYNIFIQFWLVLNFVTTTYCLYQVVIAVAGLFKKRVFVRCAPKNRFAAIISARNEEGVIASLIESLKLQNYPRELFDVIIVADNCTDDTAKVAREAGAVVYERYNQAEIGKGHALKFVFKKIFEERDRYDAFCIFDADNIVDRDFFLHMNDAIEAGYEVAQGYRDMKNPADSWISGGHSLFFWTQNRFFNQARSFMGNSATINGTAYMIKAALIREIGYSPATSTEDIEFTMQCVLAGKRIGWVPGAKAYDEQPTTLSQSLTQRMRWINGMMQNFRRYAGPLAKKMVDSPDWDTIDALLYICGYPVMLFGVLSGALGVCFAFFRIFDPIGTLLNTGLILVGAIAALWFIGLLTLVSEKKYSGDLLRAVAWYPVFTLFWVIIYIVCVFKKRVEWKPIAHVRNISITEIESQGRR